MARSIASFLAGVLTALAIAALAGLVVVYSGAYNVAATEEHASIGSAGHGSSQGDQPRH